MSDRSAPASPEPPASPASRASRAALTGRIARLRVPLGFACAALVWWLAAPTRATLLVGTAIAVVGEALRVWAAGHLNKSREVTSSGPYRLFAHPLYVGSSVMALGLVVAAASLATALAIALYMTATITAAIRHEEAFLRARFGDEYDSYRRGASSDRAFSLRQAIANREYRAAIGLLLAVLLLVWKAFYNGSL